MKRIALVTQLTADKTPLVSNDSLALAQHADLAARHGIAFHDAAWDDPAVRWADFDALVIKSTWNYHLPENMAAFGEWLTSVEPLNLWNPARVLRWNSDKAYLQELADAGVPVVPSVWRAAGETLDVQAAMAENGWTEAVVKPRTGASAFGVMTVKSAQDAAAADARLAEFAVNGAVIQPLLEEIRTDGEWSFLYYRDGSGRLAFSHAALKKPLAGRITVQGGTFEVVAPPENLLRDAGQITRAAEKHLDTPLLYARVDAIARGGSLVLMELELLEPSMFLDSLADIDPIARYVKAIASVV